MDPLTVFVIATLMMLANGAVLGLIHRDLPEALRPSAVHWRIGTLLQAGGCILLAVQQQLPAGFILPLANGMIILGVTAYWSGLRRFYARPNRWSMLLPLVAGVAAVWWYAVITPDLARRVWLVSICWAVLLGGCLLELVRAGQAGDRARSRRVLMAVLIVVSVFMLVRAMVFVLAAHPGESILDFRHAINQFTPLLVSIMPVIGTTAFLLMCFDRIRRQWEQAASTDHLTGLPNRRTLSQNGAQRLALVRQHPVPSLAVAVIDIDHFKHINDQLGHDLGDAALCHVAKRMCASLDASDLVGRQGGEEFVALLAVTDATQACAKAEALRQQVAAEPFQHRTGAWPITVSIGVTLLQHSDSELDDLLRRADQALYAAKHAGRNQVRMA